jgi:hypothetical protein
VLTVSLALSLLLLLVALIVTAYYTMKVLQMQIVQMAKLY